MSSLFGFVIKWQRKTRVRDRWESWWDHPRGMAVFSACSCRYNKMSLLDSCWLQRATGTKSNDGLGTQFNQLFETNCCSRTTDSMTAYGEVLIIVFHIEHSVLPVPLHLLWFWTLGSYLFASEGISYGQNYWVDYSQTNFQMWCHVGWVLNDILISVDLIERWLHETFGKEKLDFLVEVRQTMGLPLFLRGFDHLFIELPSDRRLWFFLHRGNFINF